MEPFRRALVGLTFLTCCLALVLMCVAFATQHWVEAEPARHLQANQSSTTTSSSISSSSGTTQRYSPSGGSPEPYKGDVHLGLFEGAKILNPGFGSRKSTVYIICKGSVCMWSKFEDSTQREDEIQYELNRTRHEVSAPSDQCDGFFSFGVWASSIAFLAGATCFGLLGAIFAAVNTTTVPVGRLPGILGLFLWNGTAGLFTIISIVLWASLYHSDFKCNVMTPEEMRSDWMSRDSATFGYSFWILLAPVLLFALNIVLLYASTHESGRQKRTNVVVNEKPADGIIMLY